MATKTEVRIPDYTDMLIERTQARDRCKALVAWSEGENRSMTRDESREFDSCRATVKRLDKVMQRLTELREAERASFPKRKSEPAPIYQAGDASPGPRPEYR